MKKMKENKKKNMRNKKKRNLWTPGYTPTDRLTSWGVLHYPCTWYPKKMDRGGLVAITAV